MTSQLLPALAGYIPRDRVERIITPGTSLPEDGIALIADISGFTPLTEALTHGLSADAGAEELTRALSGVFTPLIAEIHAFRGSVIKFGGDALIVWYPREPRVRRSAVVRRALTSAWRMQQAIKVHGQVPTPIGTVTLKMKVGFTYGSIKRFNLGLVEYGFEDVLGGDTLDRMADAEHHAEPGDIMVDDATLDLLPGVVTANEWRDNYAVVGQIDGFARPKPWPPLTWDKTREAALIEQLIPYVPQAIYETLATGREQVAELKPVISLFIQFHGIEYDTDPEVGEKLQTYFTTAQEVIARYDGRLNRLITGDKGSLIHVIFGAPRLVEEQEIRAIRCALDLQTACEGLPFITMQRIGVSRGRVFAGPVGSPNRHDYTTMGDSINLSARLMQNAADHQILMEAAVREELGSEFEIADLGTIKVKGKTEPISVFAATGFTTQPIQPHLGHIANLEQPLFGRDEELALLQRQLNRLSDGGGNVVAMVGEVGMGKTHIFEHLRHATSKSTLWAGGICLAYGQTLSGYLFIDLIRHLIELPPHLSPEAASDYLHQFCVNLFGSNRLESTYPYLARFMSLPLDGELAQRLEGLAGESLRWQVFEVIRELLILLAAQRPIVLALDDLQWIDATSLQLLETILTLPQDHPLLIVIGTRSAHEGDSWHLYAKITEVAPEPHIIFLDDLSETEAMKLVNYHLPNLPEHLGGYLVEKSGGNPLFLVELVRTLQAQGIFDEDGDPATITIDALDLPDSVQGLLLAQIDRLTVEARHTLQMASVVGKTFLSRILVVLAKGEAEIERQLPILVNSDYVLPDIETNDDAYSFRHILIQESAYGTLLYERRRAYHQQVAEAMTELFPDQITEQSGLLGFHYERAGDFAQAITYHLQAADQSRLLYANQEAETLYHKVLSLLDQQESEDVSPDLDLRARTYLKIAQVRANALDFEGAQEFYNQAFDLLDQIRIDKDRAENDGADINQKMFRLPVRRQVVGTLDPGLSEMSGELEVINNLFEGLVELDTELNIIPALARYWRIEDGGKTYKFQLRENLQWSDGVPLTAHDFVFAWRRNLDPKTGAGMAPYLYVIAGAEDFHYGRSDDSSSIAVRAIDNLNLEVTLNVPSGHFPYLLAHSITYPQPRHIILEQEDQWSSPEHLVCNGPFQVEAWQDEAILLEKNVRYHSFMKGNLEKVALHFLEPNLQVYVEQKVDYTVVDDQADIPRTYPEDTFFVQYLETFYVGFSHHQAPFDDRWLRQAFAKSINKKELVREVWANVQRPAMGGMVPPGMPGHSPEIGHQFDPTQAQAALNQAQIIPDAVTLGALPGFGSLPAYLQQSWSKHLGISVNIIEGLSFDELAEGMEKGEIQLSLIGFLADYPDPDNILRVLFHSNSPMNDLAWQSAAFDRLVEEAASSVDQQHRLALYHQADQVLVYDEIALLPLYYRQAYGVMRPEFRVQDTTRTIRGGSFKLKDITCLG